jgi:hypothetical protein
MVAICARFPKVVTPSQDPGFIKLTHYPRAAELQKFPPRASVPSLRGWTYGPILASALLGRSSLDLAPLASAGGALLLLGQLTFRSFVAATISATAA